MQYVAIAALLLIQSVALTAATRSMIPPADGNPKEWFVRRANIESDLRKRGGKHLVIVRYHAGHDIHQEWVFNGADPTHSPIVWARWDQRLIDQLLLDYPERSVWMLNEFSENDIRIEPYEAEKPSA
jgi:hypothetical protein